MKRRSIIVLAFLAALLLTACTPAASLPTNGTTPPTVADIFNETTASTESTDSAQETTAATEDPVKFSYVSGFGIGGKNPVDEHGSYRVYSGGEMTLPLSFQVGGELEYGVGVLLFVDGLPQPYKTDDEPEYAYMHTFYPGLGPDSIRNVYFTPITGQEGDALELYVTTVNTPTYSLSDGQRGWTYTSGHIAVGVRLKYEATPPEDTYPEQQMQLSDATITYIDTPHGDIAGWSSTDLQEKVEYRFSVNSTAAQGKSSRQVYDVSAGDTLPLRYELWGSPYVNFGLVFYVDNEPVYDADLCPILPEIQNGQKFVLEANLNLPEFDGESVVYAVLVPRNCRTSEVLTFGFLQCSGTVFLLEGSAE